MQRTAAPVAGPAGLLSHSDTSRAFPAFAWGVLAYNVAVILWGALVRATGSGAGCGGHWPLCNGEVLPAAPATATIIELTHRVMSGIALAAVAVLFVWAFREYPRRHPARRWAAASLVFICTEALIGAALVLLGHVAANESVGRVYSLSAHLVNTFLLLASLALTAWWAPAKEVPPAKRHPWILGLPALAAVTLVAMAGAVTALGDTLFPAHSLAEGVRQDFAATAHFLIRLRIIHPVLAIATALYLALLAAPVYLRRGLSRARLLAGLLLVAVAAQIAAGGATVLLRAPLTMQLIHLLLADALWIVLILFLSEQRRA